MKRKPKHTSVQRLYWKNAQRRWRAAHPERAREIRKRYRKRKHEENERQSIARKKEQSLSSERMRTEAKK